MVNNTHENNQDFIDPVREVEEMLINELCPNPDQMTYEQLLDFQEKIGYVEKGFSKIEIDVRFFKFNCSIIFLILETSENKIFEIKV